MPSCPLPVISVNRNEKKKKKKQILQCRRGKLRGKGSLRTPPRYHQPRWSRNQIFVSGLPATHSCQSPDMDRRRVSRADGDPLVERLETKGLTAAHPSTGTPLIRLEIVASVFPRLLVLALMIYLTMHHRFGGTRRPIFAKLRYSDGSVTRHPPLHCPSDTNAVSQTLGS